MTPRNELTWAVAVIGGVSLALVCLDIWLVYAGLSAR
jgi:hypothetical protein